MCLDPVTMFAVTTAASATLGAAGSIMQGEGAAEAGKLQQQAYDQQITNERSASAFEQMRERRKQDLAASSARAQIGASGVAFTGSPAEVMAAQAGEDQLDLEAIKYGSAVRQSQLRTQGKISLFSGKQAQTAGYVNAATGFVSGISQLYDPKRAVKVGQSPFAK
jgi:hypothetical protein